MRMSWLFLACAGCLPSIEALDLNGDLVDTAVPDSDTPLLPDPLATDSVEATDGATDVPVATGPWQTTVDATDHEAWVYVDLFGRAQTTDEGPWTIAVQRFKIAVNGGVSGDEGAEVAWAAGADADPQQVPMDGWTTDAADADADDVPEYAFLDWYDYDSDTHVLTPKDRRWWVRVPDVGVLSIELLGYYDRAGTSGHVSLRITPVTDSTTEGSVP